jgi:hypothetical protein
VSVDLREKYCSCADSLLGSKKRPLVSSSISCHQVQISRPLLSPPTLRQNYRNLRLRTCSNHYRNLFAYHHLSLHHLQLPRFFSAPNKSLVTRMLSPGSTCFVSCGQSVTPEKKAAGLFGHSDATSVLAGSWNTMVLSWYARWQKSSSVPAMRWISTALAQAQMVSAAYPVLRALV